MTSSATNTESATHARAAYHLGLVVRVHGYGTGPHGMLLRRCEGLGVGCAHLTDLGAIATQAGHLDSGRSLRDEDRRVVPELTSGIGDGETSVTTRCGDNTFVADLHRQPTAQDPTRLEAPGVLEELELQDHGHWRRPKSPGLNADHGSDSDAALNPGRGLLDKVRTDGMQHHRHILHPRRKSD